MPMPTEHQRVQQRPGARDGSAVVSRTCSREGGTGAKPTIMNSWQQRFAAAGTCRRRTFATRQLLREMAAVARPNSGATKILIAVARMAKPSCDWVEGSLRVELAPSD